MSANAILSTGQGQGQIVIVIWCFYLQLRKKYVDSQRKFQKVSAKFHVDNAVRF